MRPEVGVIAEGLRRILHGWVVHAKMAGGAAVHALQAREHYLVNLEAGCQDGGLGRGVRFPLRFKLQEAPLVVLPRWRVGLPFGGKDQSQRKDAQRKEDLLESAFHYSTPPST